jgi:DNA-binding transcriptional LysR family regulator
MLDVRRLRVLVEVARTGSFSAAAEAMDQTPSAVSQQISAFEREVGVALVERGPRGVTLTEPGAVLVREGRAVFGRLDAAERELADLAGGRGGRLRLGWFATAGGTLVAQAVAEFHRAHPEVATDLFEGDPPETLARLRARELELALVYRFEMEPPLGDGARYTPLMDDPLHIGLPRGHPLAARRTVRLRDLAEDGWIQGVRGGPTAEVLPYACRAAGFAPRVVLRTDDRVVVEGLVAAGAGVALFPNMTLPAVRSDIVVRRLDSALLAREVSAALPAGAYTPPAATAMLATLHTVCTRLAADARKRLARR